MASGDTVDVAETSFSTKNIRGILSNKETDAENEDKDQTVLDKAVADMSITSGQQIVGAAAIRTPGRMDKERKIGHRRVGVGGEITYKKIQTTQIMGSIQLGIQHAVGGLASKPERDLLMQDFMTVETTNFPSEGSNHTPAHHYSEFRFKTYAPIAFRYFRDLFGIQPDDFLMSMCSASLRELSNPGASGSIFYLTDDDEFIIKTVQHKEGEFLQKLLPGYYMNLNQNPRTLLPKFFGLYCYQCNSKNVRLVAMNNLLPSYIRLHQKYDLKGSTYKRKASKSERNKSSPTFKDLDFMEHHSEGLFLEADTYNALVKTIQRDCRVLESFKIMDYSLLVAVHNLDQAQKDKLERRSHQNLTTDIGSDPDTPLPMSDGEAPPSLSFIQTERAVEKEDRFAANSLLEKVKERERDERIAAMANMFQQREREREIGAGAAARETSTAGPTVLNRSRSINRQRLVAHSTAMESIQAESEPIDEEDDVPPGGIPARSARGERLLLFVGIIDILQSYRLKKKLEHTWKSMIHDGDTVSVHRPSFYAQRFQDFMAKTVFKKIPSLDLPEIKGNHRKFRTLVTSYIALKHSPSKRKSLSRPLRQEADYDNCQASCSTHQANGNKSGSPTDHQGAGPPQPVSAFAPAAAASTNVALGSPPPSGAPIYPVVLKGLHKTSATSPPTETGSSVKSKVPPPVPPRGSPKIKRGGGSSSTKDSGGGKGADTAFGCCDNLTDSFLARSMLDDVNDLQSSRECYPVHDASFRSMHDNIPVNIRAQKSYAVGPLFATPIVVPGQKTGRRFPLDYIQKSGPDLTIEIKHKFKNIGLVPLSEVRNKNVERHDGYSTDAHVAGPSKRIDFDGLSVLRHTVNLSKARRRVFDFIRDKSISKNDRTSGSFKVRVDECSPSGGRRLTKNDASRSEPHESVDEPTVERAIVLRKISAAKRIQGRTAHSNKEPISDTYFRLVSSKRDPCEISVSALKVKDLQTIFDGRTIRRAKNCDRHADEETRSETNERSEFVHGTDFRCIPSEETGAYYPKITCDLDDYV